MNYKNYIEIVDKVDNTYKDFLNNLNHSNINGKIKENYSSVDDQFSEFIFSLVEDFYNNTILNNLKPKDGELNIFSSIILQNKKEFKLIVFTSGTRSIPNKSSKEFQEFKIRDCHAEILAFRCLKSFLIKCITYNYILRILSPITSKNQLIEKQFYLSKNLQLYLSFEEFETFDANKEIFDIFEFYEKSKLFLKDFVYFHLYISEAPCGDCSIYPLSNLFDVNEDIEAHLDLNTNLNQTGAKSIDEVLIALAKENSYK